MSAHRRAAALLLLLVCSEAACSTLFDIPAAIEFGGEPADASAADAVPEADVRDSGTSDVAVEVRGPRCSGVDPTCGPLGTGDCCASELVEGGTFERAYDGITYTDPTFVATVTSFRLDTYEVTVGRFRAFLTGYPANLPSAKQSMTPNDPGWDPTWNAAMPLDAKGVTSNCPGSSTWSDVADVTENHPMNCVTWYEASAFCLWDGGRLPTEAEWDYAAAGGAEQRAYPWVGTAIDPSYAVYGGGVTPIAPVGSKPKGNGKFGQADLAGNVAEWVVDWASGYVVPCVDCENPEPSTPLRSLHGGAYDHDAPHVLNAYREPSPPNGRLKEVGFRCARD